MKMERKVMRCRPEMMRLYAVTDRAWTKKKSLIEQVEAACGGNEPVTETE